MRTVDFEWYVLNWDFNHDTYEMYNIFNNCHVHEYTNKLCRDYKTKHMTFDEFKEELRKIIMWQEWGRCEYEIVVSYFIGDAKEYKIDCYTQVLPNLDILASYVLHKYYPRLKEVNK